MAMTLAVTADDIIGGLNRGGHRRSRRRRTLPGDVWMTWIGRIFRHSAAGEQVADFTVPESAHSLIWTLSTLRHYVAQIYRGRHWRIGVVGASMGVRCCAYRLKGARS